MITGYNTDVKHNNRVFHIQTEDKGDVSPHIESLVYVGGQILTTRRTSYEDAIREGRDDRAVQEIMERQHRAMIAAIQRGRFDAADGSPRTSEGAAAEAEPARTGDRTLDQVILDYLASEMTHEQIDCSFTPAPEFVAGREAALRIRALSSLSKKPVADASVQIRVLSTAEKPVLVFQGRTGEDGSSPVSFRVPPIARGDAVAVIRVGSSIGSTEFKFPVRRSS